MKTTYIFLNTSCRQNFQQLTSYSGVPDLAFNKYLLVIEISENKPKIYDLMGFPTKT